jgi:hypothetical protein
VLIPLAAILEAAASVRPRFLGLAAESRSAIPNDLGLLALARPGAPVPDREYEEQRPERQPDDPGGRRLPPVVARGGRTEGEDDRRDRGEAEHPAEQEHEAVARRPTAEQHQDHGADRDRADCHADCERQDLADRLAHRRSLSVGADEGAPRPSGPAPVWSVSPRPPPAPA